MYRKLSTLAALAIAALAIFAAPVMARGGHHLGHRYGHRHHGHHGHHGRTWGHGGSYHGSRGGGHRGWQGGGWRGPRVVYRGGRTVFVGRPYPVPVYGRPLVVGRPYAVYPRPVRLAGYGPGCSTTRHVGFTPWGWRKEVMTRTCIVP